MGAKRISDEVKIVSLIAVDLGLMKPKKAAKKGDFHIRNLSTWRNDPRIAARLDKALKAVRAAIEPAAPETKQAVKAATVSTPAAPLSVIKTPVKKKRVMSAAGRAAQSAAQKKLWDSLTPKQRRDRQKKMQDGRQKAAQK